MKISLTSLILLAAVGLASADLPRKMPLQSYSSLWGNSPFTSKPLPPPPGETPNPLEDYALIGVSPIGGNKYRVTLINKKQPDERIMVFSDGKNSDFKILSVTRKAGDPLGTVVSLQSGSVTGTVSYDEKLLTLTPPAAAPPQPQPGQPPIPGQPPQPNAVQVRQPRPRVVPPPTPTTPQQVQPAQQQQRPQRRRN
jgi:hypothetical protein